MINDQYTFELVRGIARQNIKDPNSLLEFYGVETLVLGGGNFRIDTANIQVLPNKVEEKTRSFINDTSISRQYKQTTRLETFRSVVVEITKNVTSTDEYKFGFSISASVVKLNADMVQKNSFSVTTRETQKVEERQIIDYPEDYTILPNTILTVKYLTTKGIAKAPVSGTAIIDGMVNLKVRLPTGGMPPYYIARGKFSLSDPTLFDTEPIKRMTPFEGCLMAETYESLEVVYSEKPISDRTINPEMSPERFSRHNGILVFDGAYEDILEGEFKKKSGEMRITMENSDMDDLYLWVWDLNTYGHDAVLSAERLNVGQSIDVEIRPDGSDRGRISWRAEGADDSSRQKEESDLSVDSGDRIPVSTR